MSIVLVGSNSFNSRILLEIDQSPAVVVAEGPRGEPELSVRVTSPPARHALEVRANRPLTGGAHVHPTPDSVEVYWHQTRVVHARRWGTNIRLELDFRPLGLAIFSDDTALHLGSGRLSGNTITTPGVGIRLATGSTAKPQ